MFLSTLRCVRQSFCVHFKFIQYRSNFNNNILRRHFRDYSRCKMDAEKTYPDIYLLSYLSSLDKELKLHLPDKVNIKVVPFDDEKNLPNILKNAEVLMTDSPFVANLLYDLPNTKWVQNSWAGIEKVMQKLDHSKPLPNFILTRYSDTYFGECMANYVMAQIVNIERRFYVYRDKQKTGEWETLNINERPRILSDLTIGILGAGNLGAAIGRYLKRYGSKIIVFVRKPRSEPSADYDEVSTNLNNVLAKCDYICNVLPSTEVTRGLLDNDALRHCQKKPYFINVGRGDIIQSSNLIKAIKEDWIAGAILDVFKEEPLPKDDPLWKMPQVYITPHIAAPTITHEFAKFAASNYMRYVNGDQLLNKVDWNTGY